MEGEGYARKRFFHSVEGEMANCVSCGREIEPGKLFCEQCYARMKGKRATLRDVGGGKTENAAAGGGVVMGGETAPAAGAVTKRVSGSLTPASQKKVVTLRPDLDKEHKEKYGKSKKRFTITITFSERTYEMLSRFGRGKKTKGTSAEGASRREGAVAKTAKSRTARGRRGPHGRPALKAVEGKTARRGQDMARGFRGWIARRERKWDGMDYAALLLTTASAVLILALSFAGWVRVSWGAAQEPASFAVSVRGVDLGAITYAIMALGMAALFFIPIAWRLGRWLRRLDFGVILLLAGILIIMLFYVNIASDQKMLDVAYRLANRQGFYPEGEQVQRETMTAAYLMVFMGVLMAFSGLLRLSERREAEMKPGGGG